jgi:hypothetical protein
MGYYIQGPQKGKAEFIIQQYDAMLLESEAQAREFFAKGYGVVCVVDNGPFEAAAYAFSEDELKVFMAPDGRTKKWLAMDKEDAEILSGCLK